ncbi:MAG: methylated-DNA--[protein]-cysteine S-methyltransferase [Candidatus Dormibacteria bacterium]
MSDNDGLPGLGHDDRELRAAGSSLPGPSAATMERLAARALAEGLVDIAYGEMDSPLGPLLIAVTERGLVLLAYRDYAPGALDDLARRLSPRILERPQRTDPVRRELDEYFAGRRREFDLAIDWSLVTGFRRRVLEATAAIPFGRHLTYAEVAAKAGNPRASRAAGNALGSNPVPIVVPCHRVLRTGGGLGGYTSGIDRKLQLLALEGVQPGPAPSL